ncbi:uncharacterized protein LOC134539076 [Bacillus rossius redtenbacheri]|uniref:uncharacterized protein LOC134539076 n=1 Tax=Bacillus rossius redtenbacheri TaxID=93214 RepID=UPI002FDE5A57
MGVRDAAVRARILEAVRNCQLRRAAQSPSRRQFSVVDGTRILVGCANQLDTLCNLLKYARRRLAQRPAADQYLHGRYTASEGARDVALALLVRARRLHGDLHRLQGLTAQAGEKPRPAARLPGPHDRGASRLLTAALVVFPVMVSLAVWKMRASPFRT